MAGDLTFTLGSVVFGQNSPHELPEDGLMFDWIQKLIVTEFDGGYKSGQALGEFPQVMEWSGKLFGANAESRHWELKKLESNATIVTLSIASVSMQGAVHRYKGKMYHQNEWHYTIVFEPFVDNSSPSTGGTSSTDANSTLANSQKLAQMVMNNAAPTLFPANTQANFSDLTNSVNTFVTSNGGDIANASSSDVQTLQGQISNVQDGLTDLITGNDPIAASTASDLNGFLSTMNSALSQGSSQIIGEETNVVNPNLYAIAAKNYGDPSKWEQIADANNLGADPFPIGTFAKLIIPKDTSNVSAA